MKKSSNNTNDVFIKSIKKNVFESIKIKWITSCSSSGMVTLSFIISINFNINIFKISKIIFFSLFSNI